MNEKNLKASVGAIGLLHYFSSFGGPVMGSCLVVIGTQDSRAGAAIMGLIFLGLSVFLFKLGYELRQFRPWARTVTYVLSCIGLFGFPVGTLINAAILYVLISGEYLFAEKQVHPGC